MIIFIIPYRKRKCHLFFFKRYMNYIMEDYKENEYRFLYVHQDNNLPFNRGAMKNLGFLYIKEIYPDDYKSIILVFNDVDTVPYKKNLLNYDVTPNIIKHFYGHRFALGGIFSIRGEDFEKINGFPNYWGWGFEDNVVHQRALEHKLIIDRSCFYPIQSHDILHFYDETVKTIDQKNLRRQMQKRKHENDGISFLKNYHYTYDDNDQMLHIKSFKTKYDHNSFTPYHYNITNGPKIKPPRSLMSLRFL